jgi:hypothetical protein
MMRWVCIFEFLLMTFLGCYYKDPLYFIALGIFTICIIISESFDNLIKVLTGLAVITNKDKFVQK